MHDNDNEADGDTAGDNALRGECERLRAELDMCREDLYQARNELAQAREIQEWQAEQLCADKGTLNRRSVMATDAAAGATMPRRRVSWPTKAWRRMRMTARERALEQDIRLLHQSDLFDADWYLTEYPDVGNASIDPAAHYLSFGAAEGRDPGPSFNTDAYRHDHPEVMEAGINPLVHFLHSQQSTKA